MNTILGIKFRDYGQIYFFTLPGEHAPPALADTDQTELPQAESPEAEMDNSPVEQPATIDADADEVLDMLGTSV